MKMIQKLFRFGLSFILVYSFLALIYISTKKVETGVEFGFFDILQAIFASFGIVWFIALNYMWLMEPRAT